MFNFKFKSKSGTKLEFNFNGAFLTVIKLLVALHHPAVAHGIALVKEMVKALF